ncbi:hypothetical protein CJF32_00006433 [Rutstroemia sp. NJR-2017a WRK4]|nr:hypothetical protein CJF32_00006433 [Rutstroemia sp. NJR-2017a WRK4]
MSSSCGLYRPSSKSTLKSTTPTPPPRILRRRESSTTTQSTGSSKRGKRPTVDDVKAEQRNHNPSSKSSFSLRRKQSESEKNNQRPLNNNNPRRRSADFQWAREDQLSVILEILESESRNTPIWEQPDPFRQHTNHPALQKPSTSPIPETVAESPQPETPIRIPKYNKIGAKEREYRIPAYYHSRPSTKQSQQSLRAPDEMSISESKGGETPETPRPIPHPPRDTPLYAHLNQFKPSPTNTTPKLESIARIDASLVFEHFTTQDAWVLGSALRERLLPIPTPVVIDISLANANQILFHCCTHSGTMPDNDSWVSRKRKTVLRWGVSTWYMSCKFDGDEVAFRDKYGLGNSAGEYAIHGGGVPIRVTGVEGVVAVVVVSGLKQNEDHGVIVEVIKDLYY